VTNAERAVIVAARELALAMDGLVPGPGKTASPSEARLAESLAGVAALGRLNAALKVLDMVTGKPASVGFGNIP
jgi:hypothetical protein